MARKGLVGSFVPSQLTIVISHKATNSTFVLAGFAADTAVTIERQNPTWEGTDGIDGYHQRTHRLQKTLNATVSLMQISEYNDFLSGMLLYDENDLRNGGLFTCTITDKSGRSFAYSDQSYVSQPTNYTFSQNADNRDWVITLPYAEQHIGGSVKVAPEHVEILSKLGIDIDSGWYQEA